MRRVNAIDMNTVLSRDGIRDLLRMHIPLNWVEIIYEQHVDSLVSGELGWDRDVSQTSLATHA